MSATDWRNGSLCVEARAERSKSAERNVTCTPLDEGICYENFRASALIALLQQKKYYENLCRGFSQGNDFTMKKPGTLIRPGFYVGLYVASKWCFFLKMACFFQKDDYNKFLLTGDCLNLSVVD